nr:cytochrome P450 [Sphingomonas sp. CDS-1]
MVDLGSFSDTEVQRCPFPFIHSLHEQAPIYPDPRTGFHVVTRYKDIAYISINPQLFSNQTAIVINEKNPSEDGKRVAALYEETGYNRIHTMVTNDPPSHTAYRGLVDKVFTASFVKSLEPYITDLADELIDNFCETGKIDLMRDFCIRLPMYVIVDQLGLSREEWEKFKMWSDSTMALIDPALPIEERLHLSTFHIEMQQYLVSKGEEYRKAPVDKMLSNLANAQLDGRYLTPTEFVSIAEQLFVAGNETTTSAIGHAVRLLIRNPDVYARLRENPAKVGAFTEEVLRLHAPSPHLYREVKEDTEIDGYALPKGSIVMLSYLAGNYDPSFYECPEKIDLDRKGIRNHLAFGRGIHYCLGNLLARAELKLGMDKLIQRLPNMRFDPDYPEPSFAPIFHVHTLDSMHILFDPTPRRA